MKDFLELIKNPKEFIQYIIRNIINNLIKLIEILGLNLVKGLANLLVNAFSIVPKIPGTNSIPEYVEKFKDNKDKKKKSQRKMKALDKVLFSNELSAYNSSQYQSNLFDLKEQNPNIILPLGYDYSTRPNDYYNSNIKRNTTTYNDKNLNQWKKTPYIARPWYTECSRGLCYNFNSNTFDDVGPNDMGFVATI